MDVVYSVHKGIWRGKVEVSRKDSGGRREMRERGARVVKRRGST